MRSDLSGISTLTACAEITRPLTLNGGRPSNVKTIGNADPGLRDQLLCEKPRFQVTFSLTITKKVIPLLYCAEAMHPLKAPDWSFVNAPPLQPPILMEPYGPLAETTDAERNTTRMLIIALK